MVSKVYFFPHWELFIILELHTLLALTDLHLAKFRYKIIMKNCLWNLIPPFARHYDLPPPSIQILYKRVNSKSPPGFLSVNLILRTKTNTWISFYKAKHYNSIFNGPYLIWNLYRRCHQAISRLKWKALTPRYTKQTFNIST